MTYREIAPTAALRPWVECFWTRGGGQAILPVPVPVNILPDGCADLVFELTRGDAMAVGTMTKPLVLPAGARGDFFGVRFRPGRAAAFLRLPLAEITDARVPLQDVWKSWSGEISIPAIESELMRRLRPDRDARVDAAIERITAGAGRVDDIARHIGISRQHLARQFQQHVGVSPKTFARVMRFRRLLADCRNAGVFAGWPGAVSAPNGGGTPPDQPPRRRRSDDQRDDWAARAARHGYYDQSHLIADFRELAGTTPAAFR
ncbi:MAG TPA: DUF6597 domain-containing transcriptional factor [Thermoanaerobaculia bacterium]|nr:DUF6597 domain-containing transcriptional factor [Thermoanaerobaculia bacterium]